MELPELIGRNIAAAYRDALNARMMKANDEDRVVPPKVWEHLDKAVQALEAAQEDLDRSQGRG